MSQIILTPMCHVGFFCGCPGALSPFAMFLTCFWGVWHISSLLPQSITEMTVVGGTTVIRHLLAEAGGVGKRGLARRPARLRER